MKTVKEYQNEVFIDKENINRYFTTVQKAIEYFELVKKLRIEDLDKVNTAIQSNNLFNNSLRWNVATNNQEISNLYKSFESDLIGVLVSQIEDTENKIEALKTFLD